MRKMPSHRNPSNMSGKSVRTSTIMGHCSVAESAARKVLFGSKRKTRNVNKIAALVKKKGQWRDMFTGLVEATGRVVEARRGQTVTRLDLALGPIAQGIVPGDSIAVSGVCLTVTELQGDRGAFELVPETLRRTTLAHAVPGVRVNLERALKLGDRLGGHLVQGHVDGTAV